ncbi:MAG: T9SS type A sorting domain-containing protein [Clostridia bacterium]|nr:T9SS type A sorting domain-containing protein [Clostridia bacterium]
MLINFLIQKSIKTFTLVYACCLLFAMPAHSQLTLPLGFQKTQQVTVTDSLGNRLDAAWAGGMNACQFGEADLDGDGKAELIVFDRHGNRTLTYKNNGSAGQTDFAYSPSLARRLPHFDDWVIFADYNADGRNDIFAYSKGYAGVQIFRNTGDTAALFERVVYPYLKSFQGNGYVNVLTTYADYPAIVDLDGDGDLDLLTFWGLGAFVEMHLNESMEKYGVPDSLIFRRTNRCWGRFAESEESNVIYLDTCFGEKTMTGPESEPKHTGSTFLIFDNNGDGLPDLLLGDVDYPAPALLINGGTPELPLMTSHTFSFPDYDVPIHQWSFPVMSYLDVNNDGAKDLIVSPFDPSLEKAQHHNNVWLYENNGQTNQPDFQLTKTNFLQDQMLDFGAGAYPAFFDYNHDGLMDLLVGNFGYIDSTYYGLGLNLYCDYRAQLALLVNTGTATAPSFQLIDRYFVELPANSASGSKAPFAAVPAFADLDGDGDEDMLVGNADGTLFYYENVAAQGENAHFELSDTFYQQIDVGDYSAPQLFDLDKDGRKDLIIGKRDGKISFYKNQGTDVAPNFVKITDSLGGVNVTNPNLSIFGYGVPHFYRDATGTTYLFVGSEFGEIHFYNHIDDDPFGKYHLEMQNYMWIDEGLRSAAVIAHLDDDAYPDMIVGNYCGGLTYFKGTTPPPAAIEEPSESTALVTVAPNPANDHLNIITHQNVFVEIQNAILTDLYGRKIFEIKNPGKNISTADVPDGIYLLQLSLKHCDGKQQQAVFKIIIQHR